MVKLVNRAKMKVASGGAGTLTLGTACDGYQTFAAGGVTDQDKLRYTITDGNDWEIGVGTYTASGTTLARAVTESSNSGNAITCSSEAEIFVTMSAEDFTGNAAPAFSTTPPATIYLETDGSTAITLASVAVDEFPVRYSWDGFSGTSLYDDNSLPPQLASAPTFSGGTASLIGSSTKSDAGSFRFRIKATDGVKTATAITNVTLSFKPTLLNASFDNLSFSVASQETNPTGLAFNLDGTKMFVVGTANDTVFEYDLATGFDLTSGNVSYSTDSASVAGQSTNPTDVTFNSDGTKMFILETTANKVFEYDLATGFSMASGNVSFSNDSFSLASQLTSPRGMTFNSDGTKMFVVELATDTVFEYDLATGFSMASSNVSYSNNSFSVASQETTPLSITFNSDGNKMFIVGASDGHAHQYSLSTEFSLAAGNVSYDNLNFSLRSQELTPTGMAFSADGTKMFVVGLGNDTVFQYSVDN